MMREAGLLVGRTLEVLREAVRPGITTGDLDRIAEEHIRDNGGVPSFKGYSASPGRSARRSTRRWCTASRGPAKCCGTATSCRSTAARSSRAGTATRRSPSRSGRSPPEQRRLLRGDRDVAVARAGGRAGRRPAHRHRAAIEAYVRSQGSYGIVEGYGGHGIGTEMHQDPHVLNHGPPGRGPVLEPGMCSRSSRWSTSARRTPRSWTTAGRSSPRRPVLRALRAHVRGDAGRPPRPDGPGRGPGVVRRARRQGLRPEFGEVVRPGRESALSAARLS